MDPIDFLRLHLFSASNLGPLQSHLYLQTNQEPRGDTDHKIQTNGRGTHEKQRRLDPESGLGPAFSVGILVARGEKLDGPAAPGFHQWSRTWPRTRT